MNDVSKGVEPEQANPEQVVSEDVSEKKTPEEEDNVIIPSGVGWFSYILNMT